MTHTDTHTHAPANGAPAAALCAAGGRSGRPPRDVPAKGARADREGARIPGAAGDILDEVKEFDGSPAPAPEETPRDFKVEGAIADLESLLRTAASLIRAGHTDDACTVLAAAEALHGGGLPAAPALFTLARAAGILAHSTLAAGEENTPVVADLCAATAAVLNEALESA